MNFQGTFVLQMVADQTSSQANSWTLTTTSLASFQRTSLLRKVAVVDSRFHPLLLFEACCEGQQ
jgi:hypothetical protein